MEQPGVEPGTELVLDNRKLIIGFVLLAALCGACFVIGFMEGKRQAVQAKVEPMPPAAPSAGPSEGSATGAAKIPAKTTEDFPAKDRSIREQLDWYKNVQGVDTNAAKSVVKTGAEASAPATPKTASLPPKTAPPPPEPKSSKPPAPAVAVPAAKISYSVQVGAFKQQKEAEASVAELKAKGFDAVIDPPRPDKQYFRVKVGKFESKADAIAMMEKLAKLGISCYVRTY
jgi:cell division protein FtsN